MNYLSYKGYTIFIEQDVDPDSPRDWDNLGTMVCFNSRRNLGDKHDFKSPEEFKAFWERTKAVVLPLYLYDHSGYTMNTTGFSCPWDSGQVGWIYVTPEKIRKEYSWKHLSVKRRKTIKGYLKEEVKTYDQYLTGDVYGIAKITDPEGKELEDGSVWGFYGSDHKESGLMENAEGTIEYDLKVKAEVKMVTETSDTDLPLLINKLSYSESKNIFNQRCTKESTVHIKPSIVHIKPITSFLGRNGVGKCKGIHVYENQDKTEISLYPITSKDVDGRCRITFPVENRREIALAICPELLWPKNFCPL